MRMGTALLLAALPGLRAAQAEGGGAVKNAIDLMPWRAADDIIEGWDWSLPTGVKPVPYSGVKFWDKADRPFPGNRYVSIKSSWRECEPKEGDYDFEPLRKKIKSLSAWCAGAELHIYASVAETKYFTGSSLKEIRKTTPGTAPEWLVMEHQIPTRGEKPKTNLATPFQVVNYDIWRLEYHSRYLKFVEAFGRSGIARMKEVLISYVHGKSASRGEEAGGRYEGTALERMKERLAAWAKAFKGVEHKLAWVGHKSDLLDYAYDLGMGQRNGFVEMYLMHCENPHLGQSIDEDGYLIVDETCPPIRHGRAFGDENEEYNKRTHVPRFGPIETWAHRYRESMLRALQMRRNFIWAEGNPWVDTQLLSYVGLELGRNTSNTPDVWCYLRQSYVRSRGKAKPVKNFERWLFQRDRGGYRTLPAVKVTIPDQLRCHHPKHKYDYIARRTDMASGNSAIGFAVDDRFLSRGPYKVAIKVTYHDIGKGKWSMVYLTPNGEATCAVSCENTGKIKTATFFLDDASFPAKGTAFDFEIRATGDDATISFVRVIRTP